MGCDQHRVESQYMEEQSGTSEDSLLVFGIMACAGYFKTFSDIDQMIKWKNNMTTLISGK